MTLTHTHMHVCTHNLLAQNHVYTQTYCMHLLTDLLTHTHAHTHTHTHYSLTHKHTACFTHTQTRTTTKLHFKVRKLILKPFLDRWCRNCNHQLDCNLSHTECWENTYEVYNFSSSLYTKKATQKKREREREAHKQKQLSIRFHFNK